MNGSINFITISEFITRNKQIILGIMRKFTILLFVFISCVSHPTAKNWYVSTTSSGNASGDSWTNKKALKNFDPRTLSPGDTLFIDGSSNGLTYNEPHFLHSGMLFYIYETHGTSTNKIVITRGRDLGHNGAPLFTSTTLYGIYLNKSEYIEISHLKFGNMGDTRTQLTLSSELGNPNGIDIFYNEFDYVSGTAIEMSKASDIRIIGNRFTSGPNGQTLSNDAIKSNSGITNLEIAFNTFEGNSNSTLDGNHTDFLQASGGTQGIMKIHHNFYIVKSGQYQGIYGEFTGGVWYIYDNIFKWENSADGELAPVGGGVMNLENQVGGINLGNLSVHFYNNTVIMGDNCNWGIYAADTLNFKNNLIKSTGKPIYASLGVTAGNTVAGVQKSLINYHFDYNQYSYSSSSSFLSIAGISDWTTWRTSYAQDAHSEARVNQFSLIDEASYKATDYMLVGGSSGIDEGTDLSAYFDDDFAGTKRPVGTRWDVGAFEWTGTKVGADNTPPTLLGASVVSPNTIELLFSEELESSSAQTKSNYTISNGITVNSATLSLDKKKVTLSTSTNSANQNYTVTVTNVKDLSGNVIFSNNSAQYSFSSTTTGNLKANIKVYLQGAYSGSAMIAALADNSFLPSYQPYNSTPWNYNGSEKISISNLNGVVDWVLVELRNAQNPTQIVSRRAGLLRNDGVLLETDGTTGITFNNLLYGSYYISVRHRNHLAVMSSSPIQLAPSNSYDFTKSLTSAFGQNAEVELVSGVFGMYAGDGNADGNIDDTDRNSIWSNQNGNMGYLNGDFNLDCGVTVKDTNNFWNVNQGKVTQIP